ncbi:MAG TPA: hypothetical protein VGN64_23770, partial [Dyadobacter sp.]|nr:hypothetical protein [Dyadobacter sp.]
LSFSGAVINVISGIYSKLLSVIRQRLKPHTKLTKQKHNRNYKGAFLLFYIEMCASCNIEGIKGCPQTCIRGIKKPEI